VICCVFFTERMRRLRSSWVGIEFGQHQLGQHVC
jgi:hypothetical protein